MSSLPLGIQLISPMQIFDISNATMRKENLNQDKDVKVGSYCQSASVEMLNKESKGIQPVLTFSDVPPSTLKAEVVENNDFGLIHC